MCIIINHCRVNWKNYGQLFTLCIFIMDVTTIAQCFCYITSVYGVLCDRAPHHWLPGRNAKGGGVQSQGVLNWEELYLSPMSRQDTYQSEGSCFITLSPQTHPLLINQKQKRFTESSVTSLTTKWLILPIDSRSSVTFSPSKEHGLWRLNQIKLMQNKDMSDF